MPGSAKKRLYIDAGSIITPRPSGIGSTTIQLIHALDADTEFLKSHEIVLFAPFNKAHLIDQWGFQHVSIRRLPLPGRVIAGLIKLHLMPPLDIWLGKGTYLFPNFRNTPLLFSRSLTYIHDASFKVYPEYVETKNRAFLTKNVGRWIQRTDKVITVSEHAKTEIIRFYPAAEGKISVVYNGINGTFVPHDESAVKDVLERYGLTYKNYFMFLSNIEPRKNIDGLLAAYEQFIQEPDHKETKLLLVGGMGWNNTEVLATIARINQTGDHIIIPDHYVPDSELPQLLSGAAALLHPAHYEGFGISPLQAMACGTQLVVANNSSLPEVVGDAGEYVDSRKNDEILDAMQVVYNKRHDLNAKGISRAATFTWKKSAAQLAEYIEELESK